MSCCVYTANLWSKEPILLGKAGSSIIIACEPPHVGELFGLVWKGRVIDDVPVEHIELVHLHQVQVGLQHRLCNVVSEGVSNSGEYFFLYRMSSTCLCQGGLRDVQNVESRGLECRSQQTGRMCPLCFATKLDQDNWSIITWEPLPFFRYTSWLKLSSPLQMRGIKK